MFSANENIVLRQHKRRVIEFIESTIPENALELGTSVMVMQVSCRQPGCVPLETAITIVFPKPLSSKKKKKKKAAADAAADDIAKENGKEEIPAFPKPLIPDLEESRVGGSFKTRILKPLAEVTLDDILDALPPNFEGGRRTIESICLKARDMMFAQIGQLVGSDDTSDNVNGRRLVSEYLKACLVEYEERGFIPPEWGEQYTPLDSDEKKEDNSDMSQKAEEDQKDEANGKDKDGSNTNTSITMDSKFGSGNFVFRRPFDSEDGK